MNELDSLTKPYWVSIIIFLLPFEQHIQYKITIRESRVEAQNVNFPSFLFC